MFMPSGLNKYHIVLSLTSTISLYVTDRKFVNGPPNVRIVRQWPLSPDKFTWNELMTEQKIQLQTGEKFQTWLFSSTSCESMKYLKSGITRRWKITLLKFTSSKLGHEDEIMRKACSSSKWTTPDKSKHFKCTPQRDKSAYIPLISR